MPSPSVAEKLDEADAWELQALGPEGWAQLQARMREDAEREGGSKSDGGGSRKS